MAEAVRVLAREGQAPPICVGVHAVFAAGAEETLRAAGVSRIATCNTIVHATNAVDVLPALASGMKAAIAGQVG